MSKFDIWIDDLYRRGWWGRVLVWITIIWLAGLAVFGFMSAYALAYAVFGDGLQQ